MGKKNRLTGLTIQLDWPFQQNWRDEQRESEEGNSRRSWNTKNLGKSLRRLAVFVPEVEKYFALFLLGKKGFFFLFIFFDKITYYFIFGHLNVFSSPPILENVFHVILE